MSSGQDENRVLGTNTDDNLTGTNEADILQGRAGDDILDGGVGADTYIGGSGSDRYVLNDLDAVDTLGFRSGDILDVSGLLPESGVSEENLKQFIKVTSNAVYLDGAGTGKFTDGNKIARFAENNSSLDAMIAVQVADTSVIHFDWQATANIPLSDGVSATNQSNSGSQNQVTGTFRSDELLGTYQDDALFGQWGDDTLAGGDGADLYVGGQGDDRYVLSDDEEVDTLDYRSTRHEQDIVDISAILPATVTAENIGSYVKVTDEGIYIDKEGEGEFTESDLIAEFTESSVFSLESIRIQFGSDANAVAVMDVTRTAGVQLNEGESFEDNQILEQRLDKRTESVVDDRTDINAGFLNSTKGQKFRLNLKDHDLREVFGGDGDEELDATTLTATGANPTGMEGDHIVKLFGGAGDDTLKGNDDGGVLNGGVGNDRLISGKGRNFLVGGEGEDEYVLTLETSEGENLKSDKLYDFTSEEGHRDMIDLQAVLPAEATAENIHSYVKITESGVFIDTSGKAFFDNKNALARFGEKASFDDLIRLRLPDGSNIEFNREEALSTMHGDDDANRIKAGAGSDTLYGNAGDDVLDGDALANTQSADHLYGGEGNDKLHVDALDISDGTVDGGTGFDQMYIHSEEGETTSIDLQAAGIERVLGGDSDDVLDGSGYTDTAGGYNKVTGDYETTEAQRLELYGRAGDDTISGGIGRDYLDGGAGDDRIIDGDGRDTLLGGEGNDTFVLTDDTHIDSIYDFKATSEEQDVLDISALTPDGFDYKDLGDYFHIDSTYVYFDKEGSGTFTWRQAVAKVGGRSVLDEPVILQLDDVRVTYDPDTKDVVRINTNPDMGTTAEDTEIIFTEADFVDQVVNMEGDSLSVSNVRADNGSVNITDNGDGTWTVTPDANWSGTAGIAFDVSNGTDTATSYANVIVSDVADTANISLNDSTITAIEDTAFALNLNVELLDTDGSEILSTSLSGIPAGYMLDDGSNIEESDGSSPVDISGWDLSQLTLTPTENENSDFTITVNAVTIETASGETNTTTRTIDIDMQAVNDGPVANEDIANGAVVVDALNSNADLGFVVTSSDAVDNEHDAYMAFDGVASDETSNNHSWAVEGSSGWIEVELPEAQRVARFSITATDNPDRQPSEWELLGSTDGENYTVIHSENTVDNWEARETKEFMVSNSEAYTHFKMNILDGNGDQFIGFDEFQLFEWTDTTAHVSKNSPAVTLDVLANDTVDEGESLTLDSVEIIDGSGNVIADKGLATIIDGKLKFEPNANFDSLRAGDTETMTVRYTISDSNGVESTSEAEVTVFGSNVFINNVAPELEASEGDFSVPEFSSDSTVVGTVSAMDWNTDDVLTYSLLDDAGGRFDINSTTGEVTVADGSLLDHGSAANHTITVQVSDGALTDAQNYTIGVVNVNDNPEVLSGIENQSAIEESVFSFQIPNDAFTDPDGDSLTYSASLSDGSALPDWLNFDSGTATFSGTPDDPDLGTLSVNVTASDGVNVETVTTSFDINIAGINDAPGAPLPVVEAFDFVWGGRFINNKVATTFTMPDDFELGETVWVTTVEVGYVKAVEVQISDNGDGNFNFKAVSAKYEAISVWEELTPEGQVNYFESNGHYQSLASSNDTSGYIIGDIAVNNSLSVSGFLDSEDGVAVSPFTTVEAGVDGASVGFVKAIDVDGDVLTYTLTDDAGGRFVIDSSTGEITVADGSLLDFDAATSHSVTVQVSDGSETETLTHTIQVADQNDAPEVTTSANGLTLTEDGSLIVTEAELLSSVSAADSDGDTLSVKNVSINSGLVSVEDNGDGSWTITPEPNWSGDGKLSFSVSDGTVISPAELDLVVTPVTDAAQLTVSARLQSDPLNTVTNSVDFSDADEGIQISLASEEAQIIVSGQDEQFFDVNEVIGSAHDDTFSFNNPQAGDVFTIDGAGGANILDLSSYAASDVRLTNNSATIDLGNNESFRVDFSNINSVRFDSSITNGDPHEVTYATGSWTIEGVNLESRGLTDTTKPGITLIDYQGTLHENFTLDTVVHAHDIDGKYQNGSIIFDFQDANNYKAVTAYMGKDAWVIEERVDGILSAHARLDAVLEADTDLPLTLRVTGGVVDIVDDDNAVLVTHDFGSPVNGGAIGIGSRFSDTDFEINLIPSNWAPSLEDQALTVDVEDGSINTINVLESANDADGDPLTLTGFTQGANGTVIDNGDGTFSYTPNNGFVGVDSFTYTISDGDNTSEAVIRITVTDNQSVMVTSDATDIDLDIAAALSDDSETLSVEISGLIEGVVISDGVNTFTGIESNDSIDITDWNFDNLVLTTPNEYYGSGFDITINAITADGADTQTSSTVVHILDGNDTPELASELSDQTASEYSTFSYTIPESSFIDVDGDVLTYSATLENGQPLPDWLSFDTTTRTFSGTPEDSDVGTLAVQVTASDAQSSVSDVFSLAINDVNDAPEAPLPVLEQFNFVWGGGYISNHVAATFTMPDDFELGDTVWVTTIENNNVKAVEVQVSDNGDGNFNFKAVQAKYEASSVLDELTPEQQATYFEANGHSQSLAASNNTAGYIIGDIAVNNSLPVLGVLDTEGVVVAPFTALEAGVNGASVGFVKATDVNGDVLTYSLTDDAGGRFAIDSSTGEITVMDGSLLNYETATSHSVTIQVSDGSETRTSTHTIHIDQNDAPIASDVSITVEEAGSSVSGTTDVVDVDSIDVVVTEVNGQAVSDSTRIEGDFGDLVINEQGDWTYTPATVDLESDLVLQFNFDETNATPTALDTSTQDTIDDHGTLMNGATFVDNGVHGKAIQFDGVDDVVTLKNSTEINTFSGTKNETTISLEFKIDAANDLSGRQVLYEQGGASSGYNLYIDEGALYVGAWPGSWLSVDISHLDSSEWHQVTMVVDGTEGVMEGWLDGELFDSGEGQAINNHSGAIGLGGVKQHTTFHDGESLVSTGFNYHGLIDAPRIYNRALNAQEVKALNAEFSTDTLQDTFSYTASDGLNTSTADIVVNVTQNLKALSGTANLTENTGSVTGTLPVIDDDAGSTYELVDAPAIGTVTINADGTYAYAQDNGFNHLALDEIEVVTFTYRVTNSDGDTSTNTVNVLMKGINDRVYASDDSSATGVINGSLVNGDSHSLLDNDSDADGDTLTITEVSGTSIESSGVTSVEGDYGDLSIDAQGQWSYNPTVDVHSDLVAYWKFDEGSGTTAEDSAPLDTHSSSGTLVSGAEFTSNGTGGAVKFYGGTDELSIANSYELNTYVGEKSQRTINMEFRLNGDNDLSGRQVLYEEGGVSNGYNIYIDEGVLYVGAWVHNSDWVSEWISQDISSLANDSSTWNQVTLVLDSDSGVMRGYLNQEEMGSVTVSSGMPAHSAAVAFGNIAHNTLFHDGSANESTDDFGFKGEIDEAKIYDRALSTKEIKALDASLDQNNLQENFEYTVSDGITTDTAAFMIDVPNNLTGTGNADTLDGSEGADMLMGEAGDDIIFGDGGNDVLTGGGGSDTFVWEADDVGTVGAALEDVITDFNTGQNGDVIDLSDVLVDETNAIDDYLSLNFENGDTTIEVKPAGDDGVTQKIKLEGVDLSGYGGGTTDLEIINNLIDDGNLQID
ncbi:hypothetical protein ACH42_15130 [Endozoicomonas sp. (ex Bugula neritina AB1)]|nr:hypothetical protein ACH42_15130 [Endozoicomonas sp. (ex Bugula neritina AB1)]